jgi:P pilus assembly chaperone PapD
LARLWAWTRGRLQVRLRNSTPIHASITVDATGRFHFFDSAVHRDVTF